MGAYSRGKFRYLNSMRAHTIVCATIDRRGHNHRDDISADHGKFKNWFELRRTLSIAEDRRETAGDL